MPQRMKSKRLKHFIAVIPDAVGTTPGEPNLTMIEACEVGTLVVDMFDANTEQIIWHGVASDTITDNLNKNTKELQKVIAKMFKQFLRK